MQQGLAALRVVDMSWGIPGGYCARLLADAGADVVKVEPASGDPLRGWAVGDAAVDPVEGGALFRFLHHGMRSVVGEPGDPHVQELLAGADVVIESADIELSPSTLCTTHPGLVVVSITPYGRTGPYATRPTTEFIVQADTGGLIRRGSPKGVPFQAGGRTSEWLAGTFASVAGAAAALRAQRTGHGEHVDVSTAEVMTIAANSYSEFNRTLLPTPPPLRPSRSIETPSVEPTRDGYVGFCTNSRDQLDNFLVLIERPDLIAGEEFALAAKRQARWDEWNDIVHAWTPHHTTAEIVERASELRIPVAPVHSGADIQTCDHFVARGVFVDDPTHTFRFPRRPWRMNDEDPPPPTPSPRLGEHTDAIAARDVSLSGTRGNAGPAPRRGSGARPHRVVGGAHRGRCVGGPRRRRDPCRVGLAHRRHAHHRSHHGHGWSVVGAQLALPLRQHQQA